MAPAVHSNRGACRVSVRLRDRGAEHTNFPAGSRRRTGTSAAMYCAGIANGAGGEGEWLRLRASLQLSEAAVDIEEKLSALIDDRDFAAIDDRMARFKFRGHNT